MPDPPESQHPGSQQPEERGAAGQHGGFESGGPADSLAPGPRLAALADAAWAGGLDALADDELIGLLCAARRLASRAAALELSVVADLAARRRAHRDSGGGPDPGEHVDAEVAAALTLTPSAAATVHDLALGLARLPSVGKALAEGRIDQRRAAVIVAETSAVDDRLARAAATAIIRAACGMTTGELRAQLHRMVIFLDPAAAGRRKEAAQKQARVELWRESAGTCALSGRDLPPGLALAADKHLTDAAQFLKTQGAEGTLSQLRARAYLGLLSGLSVESLIPAQRLAARGEKSPSAPPGRTPGAGWPALTGSVNLTLPLSTWLGWSQSPGQVPGFGPVDATDSRALAAALAGHPATQWCLTLLDPAGRPVAHGCAEHRRGAPPGRPDPPGGADPPGGLDPADSPPSPGPGVRSPGAPDVAALARWLAGLPLTPLAGPCDHSQLRVRYRPSLKLQHLVRVRRRTCSFPGCRYPAQRCDLDHVLAYDRGGATCLCNLGPLCRRHHRCKQAEGWALSQDTSGAATWTTPAGRRYTTMPSAYPQ